MFNIKSIVNKIADRGRDSNPNSPGRAGIEETNKEDSKVRAEGFLCPKCMKAWTSPEELQSHYESSHDEDGAPDLQGASGFFSLHQEVGERYKQYQDVNSNNGMSRLSSSIKIEEVASITDVSVLQKFLRELLESKAILQIEKERVEQRAAQLAQINVTLKAASDEGECSQTALKERLKVVEAQLTHRESIDDAAVLRQELVQVQRVMDELNRERERERDALRTELQLLQDKYRTLEDKSTNSAENDDAVELKNMLEKKENELNHLAAELELSQQQSAQMLIKHTQEVSSAAQVHAEQIEKIKNERVSVYEELMTLVKSLRNELSLTCSEIDGSCHHFNTLKSKVESFSLQVNDAYTRIRSLQNEMELCLNRKYTLETQLLQKCQECDDLAGANSDYVSKVDELNKALTMSLDTIRKLESEHLELVEQIQAGEGTNTALQHLIQENNSLQKKLKEQMREREKYVEEMSVHMSDLKEKLKEAEVHRVRGQLNLENCQSKLNAVSAEFDKENQKVKLLQDQVTVKDEGLKDLHTSCTFLKQDLETERTQYTDLKKSLQLKEVQYNELLGLYQVSQSEKDGAIQEVYKLENNIEVLGGDLTSKVKEIVDMKSEIEIFQSNEHEFKNNIAELKQLIDFKQKQFTDLLEENEKVDELKLILDDRVETLEEQLQILGVQRASLETSLFELRKIVAELESDKKDFEEENKKEIDKLLVLIQKKDRIIDQGALALEKQAKQIKMLMKEGGEIAKHIEDMNLRHKKELDHATHHTDEFKNQFISCKLEKEELEENMATEKDKRISLEGDLVKLTESLNNAIKENYEKIQTLQVSLDETSGEKLALEAQLEASQTEQQTLLERCYSSASETDSLRRIISDLHRKLDESQAALHELGRENQTLQLDLEKLEGRKWTEDSDVTKCIQCQKDFNVIVRKHHCRNCGKIFCNECSNKSALIASYKKAVRVCEPCYNELTPK